ncbi:hypothetical protein ABZ353_33510 [Streptomyces niveus]|uniref:hypothetical protein n=1 Tax=Streptomyces TaxID=1883 RepID=UPI0011CB65B9|nr:hypothetical protein [Streptomyces sp. IB2014 016-6]TXL84708.1 hypothetical protein EW053_33280 [Streptomyces sp. IB2014 016-6]
MTSNQDQGAGQSPTSDDEHSADSLRLETARKIALESLEEDHRALELDAKLAFGAAVSLVR